MAARPRGPAWELMPIDAIPQSWIAWERRAGPLIETEVELSDIGILAQRFGPAFQHDAAVSMT